MCVCVCVCVCVCEKERERESQHKLCSRVQDANRHLCTLLGSQLFQLCAFTTSLVHKQCQQIHTHYGLFTQYSVNTP